MKLFVTAFALAALFLPSTALAQVDKSGKFALGYWSEDAPIGGRYVFSPRAAIDLGFGFATAQSSVEDSKNLQFHVEAGVPITVVSKDKANFFVRPGVLYRSIPYYLEPAAGTFDKKTASEIEVSGILGAEWFATEDFSLTAGHGLRFVSTKSVGTNDVLGATEPESDTFFDGLQALSITRIGFHYYF